MNTIWDTFADFWKTWGPFISTSLIPTIIVGLSVSPKTAEAKTTVEKVWNAVKQALDFLSVLTHKDKPGTFQLPFKLNKVIKKDVPPALILIFAMSILASQSSCSWLKGHGGKAKDVAIDCTIESIQESASNLVPAIYGILTGNSVNWKDQLTVFAKNFGKDATACALQTALEKVNTPVQSEPTEDPAMVRDRSNKRANEVVIEQGWVYKPIE